MTGPLLLRCCLDLEALPLSWPVAAAAVETTAPRFLVILPSGGRTDDGGASAALLSGQPCDQSAGQSVKSGRVQWYRKYYK